MTNILTLDPSIAAFGWAVVDLEGNKIIASGCIKTQPTAGKMRIRKGDDRCRRVSEINGILLKIIRHHSIKYICAELPHGSQSAVAAVMIGIVTGIVQTLSDTLEIPLEWFSESDSKREILGKRTATKVEMVQAITAQIEWKPTGTGYIDEAVADSLAIYLLAKHYSQVLRFLSC